MSQSTEQFHLKGADNDLDTNVMFDMLEISRCHHLSLSSMDKMHSGFVGKHSTREVASQVTLSAKAKEEPTISHHGPKAEASSIPSARAVTTKEPVIFEDISIVSSTNIDTKPPQHPPLIMDTSVCIAGMVYGMSNHEDQNDAIVFQKPSDVKDEAPYSTFHVLNPNIPIDKNTKMEQQKMTLSLMQGDTHPCKEENTTSVALPHGNTVQFINKDVQLIPQEKPSHIESTRIIQPFKSKTQIPNAGYVRITRTEGFASPIHPEMSISTPVNDLQYNPMKAIKYKPPIHIKTPGEAEEGVELEAKATHATEGAFVQAPWRPATEDNTGEAEEDGVHPVLVEVEATMEERPKEASAGAPLVEENELVVAEEAEVPAPAHEVESLSEAEKGIEFEAKATRAVVEEASVQTPWAEEKTENKGRVVHKAIVAFGLACENEGNDNLGGAFYGGSSDGVGRPLVAGDYFLGRTCVVDDYFGGNGVRLRKHSDEVGVDVHLGEHENFGGLRVPMVFEDDSKVETWIGSDVGVVGGADLSCIVKCDGSKKTSDEVSVDIFLETYEDDGGASQVPISGIGVSARKAYGFVLGHVGYTKADLSERFLTKPFQHVEVDLGVDIDNISTSKATKEEVDVNHMCANGSMEIAEWEIINSQLVEIPNNTGNAIKAMGDIEDNAHLNKDPLNHDIEKSTPAIQWEIVANEFQNTLFKCEGPRLQSPPFDRGDEFVESSDWEMVPTRNGAKDEEKSKSMEMTKEPSEIPTAKEDETDNEPIEGKERIMYITNVEEKLDSTTGLDGAFLLTNVVQNKDQETKDVTFHARVFEIGTPLENFQEDNEFSIKSIFNVEHLKKRPLGVPTRKIKHVIHGTKTKIHKVVLPTWPPLPITDEGNDNICIDTNVEGGPIIESGHLPLIVDIEV